MCVCAFNLMVSFFLSFFLFLKKKLCKHTRANERARALYYKKRTTKTIRKLTFISPNASGSLRQRQRFVERKEKKTSKVCLCLSTSFRVYNNNNNPRTHALTHSRFLIYNNNNNNNNVAPRTRVFFLSFFYLLMLLSSSSSSSFFFVHSLSLSVYIVSLSL